MVVGRDRPNWWVLGVGVAVGDVVVVTEMVEGKCWCSCALWEGGLGEMSNSVMVRARVLNSSVLELMVVSVLCSRRHVMLGSVRPFWRLTTMARHSGVFWTIRVMCVGVEMVRWLTGRSLTMRTWLML